jgi:hypothetical protein
MSVPLPEEYAGNSGNRSRNFVRDFLFGDSGTRRGDACIEAELLMDKRTEGWVDIPHGGVGMGAVMELALALDGCPLTDERLYPLSAEFRMGGSPVRVGDRVKVKVSSVEGGTAGSIQVDRGEAPYILASISHGSDHPLRTDPLLSYLPVEFSDVQNRLIPLPYYKNCFVCGGERSQPGLRRRFYFWNAGQQKKVVVSSAGFDAWDSETFCLFQQDDTIHPIVFLALLDETMGWGGFMDTGSAGVTVRADYTMYRGVHTGERVVVFGRGEKVRGNAPSRLLFWASGGVAVVRDDGSLEPVMVSSGQWLGVPALTDQMKTELMPHEWTVRAFELAGYRGCF